MSHWLTNRLRRGAEDEGFGLVEIMIAMTIFAIMVISTAPLLVGGLKAGRAAQLNLQGKALSQERLEVMRNLPYHVARQNGQYLDVLDIYFRDLQAVGVLAVGDTCSSRTYAADTRTYTCRVASLGAAYAGFSQTVRTRFLDFQRNAVSPPAAYNSQVAGQDAPVSALLDVAVTTSWRQGSRTSSYTLRSQIANAQASESTLRASLELAALTVTSNVTGGDILKLEAGLVNAEGSLTTGSTASLNVTTARASLSSGSVSSGAALSLSAPPAAFGTSPSDSSGKLFGGSCDLACFGQTAVTGNQDVTVALGQPQISAAANPVVSALRRTGSNTYRGFSYGNETIAAADPALRLATGARMVSAGSGSTADVVTSSGYVNAAGTGATAVTSYGRVAMPMLQLFPTDFAPEGVVQVTLDEATMTCTSGGGAGAVTPTWTARVRYWQQTGVGVDGKPIGAYVEHVVQPGGTPLPPTTARVIIADLNNDGFADGVEAADVPLSRWISSWGGMTAVSEAVIASGQRANGSLSAVVSLTTTPTRLVSGLPDETSAINVSVGRMSCVAEDNR